MERLSALRTLPSNFAAATRVYSQLCSLRWRLDWEQPAQGTLLWRAFWRRRRYLVLPTAHLMPATAFRPSVFRRLPLLLGLAGIAATAVALADPVVPHSTEDLQSLGIDIMLVLDLSSSMNAEMAGTAWTSPVMPCVRSSTAATATASAWSSSRTTPTS